MERTNRVVKAMLEKLTEPVDHADNVKFLGHAEFAVNNSRHKTTGRTPSELLFGCQQKGVLADHLEEYLDAKHGESQEDLEDVRRVAASKIAYSSGVFIEKP